MISINLAHRPYNSVRTNVLHCDVKDCSAQCSGVLPTLTALLALSQRACLKQQQVRINPAWHIQSHS